MGKEEIEGYFNSLESELERAMVTANAARSNGHDPTLKPEILIAKDLAGRVESLIGIKVADRIRELEREMSREEAALRIGLDFAEGKIGNCKSNIDAIEKAVRTAVALLTEGVVAAPTEGIAKIEEGRNDDGGTYVKIFYAGPIRSAGGTAQALSVLVADYVRIKLGFDAYKPRDDEIERYIEEITIYRRVANLQYTPSDDEIRTIVRNCPICIDGEPTEAVEVEGYRNLDRVDTNRVRGGVALVMAEGIALKAPKLKKYVSKLNLDGWGWINGLVKETKSDDVEVMPKGQFLKDLIAGRPVFSHPSAKGGFRLRYGRSRNSGLAACGVNSSTMILLGEFMASGTQVRLERPGKATSIVPCDTIEGPTVRLLNGDVIRIDSPVQAYELQNQVSKILDVGEILISYGDFLENNHVLVPSPYCVDWWLKDLEASNSNQDFQKEITSEYALNLSREFDVPLHPDYTYLWHDIEMDEFEALASYISHRGELIESDLFIPANDRIKDILEKLLVTHKLRDGKLMIGDAFALVSCMGLEPNLKKRWKALDFSNTIDAASKLSGVEVKKRAPTRIGGRMGRPEKSNKREMKPAPHVLFPIGEAGGRTRSIIDAAKRGSIEIEAGLHKCPKCKTETFLNRCECGERTALIKRCPDCDIVVLSDDVCPRCSRKVTTVKKQIVEIRSIYRKSLERLGERELVKLKGVQGLNSKDKAPEPFEKGILRSKHDVVVFKDGTVRYDMTDLPLTHFRPDEIKLTIDKLKGLGYHRDIHGNPITDGEQLIEIKIQDVVLSEDSGDYLLRVSKFIDDLLLKFYGMEPHYNATSKNDLIGELIIGLAPHTSAGVLGRIIGFTRASASYAHPFFHAAKRRNCDGDEDCVMLLMDGLINFSRSYLPKTRGGSMDAPLVLTVRLNANEIDGEAHNLDVMWDYPLEFYEATMEFKKPKELSDKMKLISQRLDSFDQYENFAFTHDTSDINAGPKNSAYKTLKTMVDKMEAQLNLAKMIEAVDERDVAERVINSHFIPDLMGNIRAFSKQQVRCVKCNKKYRRVPLGGVCSCGGRLILTVHEGSVKKYIEVSSKVAKEFGVSDYTKQRLELIELEINSLFDSDVSKQMDLSDFM